MDNEVLEAKVGHVLERLAEQLGPEVVVRLDGPDDGSCLSTEYFERLRARAHGRFDDDPNPNPNPNPTPNPNPNHTAGSTTTRAGRST